MKSVSRRNALVVLSCFLWSPIAADAEGDRTATGGPPIEEVRPLVRAHAHNDYLHHGPLVDALSHGYCSVEADVFLVDGMLLVGHDRSELRADRTLEALYLRPLFVRVQENGGEIYVNGPVFTLLVDIKSDGDETYMALDSLLGKYQEMLMIVRHGIVEKNPVRVIVSGDRAWERITADATRYAGVDGRLSDLSSDRPGHLMPLISDSWRRTFTWSGQGPMPDAERAELHRIVLSAHEKGRRVRFWATPDQPSPERAAIWGELLAAGVDLIGTDDLGGLKSFLLSAESPGQR